MTVLSGNSLERIVPEQLREGEVSGTETLALHVARYQFASLFVKGQTLLDIACGAGYGTALLADAHPAMACLGVDLSEAAVAHATEMYLRPNARYVVADALHFGEQTRDVDGFDTIVSLETIEHVRDPDAFADHLVTLLRPGGRLIASVPVTPSVDANPHHVTDFTKESFSALFKPRGLREIDRFIQVQPYSPIAILMRREARTVEVRRNLIAYYFRHPPALLKRVTSTLRYGFANHYLTVAWESRA